MVRIRTSCIFLLTCILLACSRGVIQVDIPTDWTEVKVNDKFMFWVPPKLIAVDVRAIDSHVQRWESQDIIVHFDYGRFSDPLTFYSRKKSYETITEQISGYSATIVSFEREMVGGSLPFTSQTWEETHLVKSSS